MPRPDVIIDAPEWKIRRVQQLRRQLAEERSVSYTSPLALRAGLDPRTVATPALELINRYLMQVLAGLVLRLIISIPPQEGKSTLVSRGFPTYALKDDPDRRIVTTSFEQRLANRNSRAVRNDITRHPELGLRLATDTSAVYEWGLDGHEGGMYAAGITGSITGRPADLLIIDDPVKDRAQAESEAHRETCWEFWTDTARPRLAPGAPVVLIMTRWHEDDLAGRLIARSDEDWTVVNIPAQADHDPAKGQTDPLGREPGEWLESARGRTEKEWETTKRASESRGWASLYQGHPAPVEGTLLKRAYWQRYDGERAGQRDDGTMHCPGADEMLLSWDMAFKDTKASDYVVGQVWARFGNQAYLLEQVRGRWSFSATVEQFRALSKRWPQALRKLVEDKANGPAVINHLRKEISGIVPVNPGTDSKTVRAIAVSPFVEASQVWLPSDRLADWAQGFIDEAAAFPNSPHDDQVDAMTQAVSRLLGNKTEPVQVPSKQRQLANAARTASLPTSPAGPSSAPSGTPWRSGLARNRGPVR